MDELCGGSDTDSDGCILEGARAAGVSDDVLELLRPAGTKRCRSPSSEQELQIGAGCGDCAAQGWHPDIR